MKSSVLPIIRWKLFRLESIMMLLRPEFLRSSPGEPEENRVEFLLQGFMIEYVMWMCCGTCC